MPQNSFQDVPRGPNTAQRGRRASQGGIQYAKIVQTPQETKWLLLSRFFASDSLPKPQDGSKM
eukprot:7717977-Pyramimonas_sp.AAC.1